MKVPKRYLVLSTLLTGLAVTIGMMTVAGPASTAEPQQYSTSSAVETQSMVKGSSLTSLGDSPLAQTPAGKAATRTAAVAAGAPNPSLETTTSSALVEYRATKNGPVTGRHRYGSAYAGKPLPAYQKAAKTGALSANSGGSSSAIGCARVTVTQTRHGATGDTLWKFHIWTDWCWTRSNETVSLNGHNWYISDFDSNFQWVGIVQSQGNYYDFGVNDGYPHSAYYHYRMGHITNCVFKYGCLADYYPVNYLRSYYNGTYVWDTSL